MAIRMDYALHILKVFWVTSPAVIALIWARYSTLPYVQRLMTRTAKIFVVLFLFIVLLGFPLEWLCEGDGLNGYSRCVVIPVRIAHLYIPIVFLSIGAFAIWTVALVIFCGVMEIANRS